MLPVLGKKSVLEWCRKEGLIGSSYVCPKCGKSMELRERTASMNQESPQPVATQIGRTAETDDCIIYWPAYRHHHNSNFSIQSEGSISPQTSTSKDSKTFYDMGRRINL
ncbi:hypothetical protein TNCV_3980561 [Trichonephila clavipes]|nr:hypothetical protein TNCV_3980561 [Trichonephila clavipes]